MFTVLCLCALFTVCYGNSDVDLCSSSEYCYTVNSRTKEVHIKSSQMREHVIFCFHGYGFPLAIFSPASLEVLLNMGMDKSTFSVDVYKGDTASHAKQISNSFFSYFYRALHSCEKENLELYFDPYSPSCILMRTNRDIHVHFRGVDEQKLRRNVFVLVVGLTMLFFADVLSKSPVVHCFIAGLLISPLSVFFPLYMVKIFLDKIRDTYKNTSCRIEWACFISFVTALAVLWVTPFWVYQWYFGMTILVGSAYVYRFYPVTEQKMLDVICGGIRCFSLLVMYQSFQTSDIWIRIVYTVVLGGLCVVFKYFHKCAKENESRYPDHAINGTYHPRAIELRYETRDLLEN